MLSWLKTDTDYWPAARTIMVGNFTSVRGVVWPAKTRKYLEAACAAGGVELYEPQNLPDQGEIVTEPPSLTPLCLMLAAATGAAIIALSRRN